jgi:hypothetical protein
MAHRQELRKSILDIYKRCEQAIELDKETVTGRIVLLSQRIQQEDGLAAVELAILALMLQDTYITPKTV